MAVFANGLPTGRSPGLRRLAPRTFARGEFFTFVVMLWIGLFVIAAATLYATVTSLLYDPTEPWELVAQVFFWWPIFVVGTAWTMPIPASLQGVGVVLAALWWLLLAWLFALFIDRVRAGVWNAA